MSDWREGEYIGSGIGIGRGSGWNGDKKFCVAISFGTLHILKERLTLNTLASNNSLPDDMASLGLSFFNVWKSPSEDRKSGMPAWTDIPAPVIRKTQSKVSVLILITRDSRETKAQNNS